MLQLQTISRDRRPLLSEEDQLRGDESSDYLSTTSDDHELPQNVMRASDLGYPVKGILAFFLFFLISRAPGTARSLMEYTDAQMLSFDQETVLHYAQVGCAQFSVSLNVLAASLTQLLLSPVLKQTHVSPWLSCHIPPFDPSLNQPLPFLCMLILPHSSLAPRSLGLADTTDSSPLTHSLTTPSSSPSDHPSSFPRHPPPFSSLPPFLFLPSTFSPPSINLRPPIPVPVFPALHRSLPTQHLSVVPAVGPATAPHPLPTHYPAGASQAILSLSISPPSPVSFIRIHPGNSLPSCTLRVVPCSISHDHHPP